MLEALISRLLGIWPLLVPLLVLTLYYVVNFFLPFFSDFRFRRKMQKLIKPHPSTHFQLAPPLIIHFANYHDLKDTIDNVTFSWEIARFLRILTSMSDYDSRSYNWSHKLSEAKALVFLQTDIEIFRIEFNNRTLEDEFLSVEIDEL